jgi:ATP-binding cassette subfamily B protein
MSEVIGNGVESAAQQGDYTLMMNAASMFADERRIPFKNCVDIADLISRIVNGNFPPTEEEIYECAKNAEAHGFVTATAEGYERELGQGGVNVSGGQRQRLCIARALLKKPKILILDDSTSAVDMKTDALLREAFKKFIPATTKIIIAQRIASVMDSDMIVVMENGQINAIGTHEELLANSDIYRDVYFSQKKGGTENEHPYRKIWPCRQR